MRTPRFSPVLLLATILAAGCGVESLPTASPDEGALEASPSVAADNAPVVFTRTLVDEAFNPCIGMVDVSTFHQTVRLQFFEIGTDPVRHHLNLQLRHDVETEAGFTGKGAISRIQNGNFQKGEFTFTLTSNITLADDAGRRWRFHVLNHVTIRDGVVVGSEVERFDSFCVADTNT